MALCFSTRTRRPPAAVADLGRPGGYDRSRATVPQGERWVPGAEPRKARRDAEHAPGEGKRILLDAYYLAPTGSVRTGSGEDDRFKRRCKRNGGRRSAEPRCCRGTIEAQRFDAEKRATWRSCFSTRTWRPPAAVVDLSRPGGYDWCAQGCRKLGRWTVGRSPRRLDANRERAALLFEAAASASTRTYRPPCGVTRAGRGRTTLVLKRVPQTCAPSQAGCLCWFYLGAK